MVHVSAGPARTDKSFFHFFQIDFFHIQSGQNNNPKIINCALILFFFLINYFFKKVHNKEVFRRNVCMVGYFLHDGLMKKTVLNGSNKKEKMHLDAEMQRKVLKL